MTDNEIIKFLECCPKEDCVNCPASKFGGCIDIAIEEALALISRQKGEIERLEELVYQAENETANVRDLYKEEVDRFKKHIVFEIESAYDRGRKAAIKEFAERAKEKSEYFWEEKDSFVSEDDIDNLVKEMVGDDNGFL